MANALTTYVVVTDAAFIWHTHIGNETGTYITETRNLLTFFSA